MLNELWLNVRKYMIQVDVYINISSMALSGGCLGGPRHRKVWEPLDWNILPLQPFLCMTVFLLGFTAP